MIAADTSTWIAFLEGAKGPDVELLDRALGERQVLMPPIVLTELLSDPQLPSSVANSCRTFSSAVKQLNTPTAIAGAKSRIYREEMTGKCR